jgi:hypothetical protein
VNTVEAIVAGAFLLFSGFHLKLSVPCPKHWPSPGHEYRFLAGLPLHSQLCSSFFSRIQHQENHHNLPTAAPPIFRASKHQKICFPSSFLDLPSVSIIRFLDFFRRDSIDF